MLRFMLLIYQLIFGLELVSIIVCAAVLFVTSSLPLSCLCHDCILYLCCVNL